MNSGIQTNGLHQLPHPGTSHSKQKPEVSKESLSFKDVLSTKLADSEQLKVSKHAQKRFQDREVIVSEAEWQKISEKMEQAKTKGVKDAMVLTDNSALVVSAENNTVITAMNREEASDHIFTNINGTIVVKE